MVGITIRMEHDPDVDDLTETGPRCERQVTGCRTRSLGAQFGMIVPVQKRVRDEPPSFTWGEKPASRRLQIEKLEIKVAKKD